jgi:hypothetical protein
MDPRERIANGLTEDLQIARASANVMFHLREMVRAKSPLSYLAQDFTWIAMRATRDSIVIHLWKALDTHPNSRSIPWFIRNHSVLSQAQTTDDLLRLSTKNPVIKRLATLRHQVFAHRGNLAEETRADELIISNNIEEAEFDTLITDASKSLARHLGRPLTMQLDVTGRAAVGELVDLDMYLLDADRGRWGIEPRYVELDGQPRAAPRRWGM